MACIGAFTGRLIQRPNLDSLHRLRANGHRLIAEDAERLADFESESYDSFPLPDPYYCPFCKGVFDQGEHDVRSCEREWRERL